MRKLYCFVFLAVLIQSAANNSLLAQTSIYQDVPGNYTFNPPAGCISFYVEMWGGGGAGSNNFDIGKAGGGSYYTRSGHWYPSNIRDTMYSFYVGRGGLSYGNGVNGDNSYFNFNIHSSNSYLYSGAGFGGVGYTSSDPTSTDNFGRSAPGYGYNMSVTIAGGNGGKNSKPPTCLYSYGGGGGGSGFSSTNGGNGTTGCSNGVGGPGQGRGGDQNQAGSSPGGGGGGGLSSTLGGSGAVRITYTCNSTGGTIGYAGGTLPYPRELISPTINNIAVATGGIPQLFIYSWQVSQNGSTNWETIPGETGTSLQVPDIDSVGWWYRRVTNSCGAKESNIIKLKVLSKNNITNGAPSKNGAITGYVRSKNGTGVAGITVQAQKDVGLKGSPQSYIYSVTTDVNGKYQFNNIFYGDKDAPSSDPTPVNFTITPTKLNHQFDPASYYPQPLSFDNYSVLFGPVFKDTSVLAVTGRVYQQCQGCLDVNNVVVNTITSGVDSAKVTGGDLPAYADVTGEGNYAATVQEPGIKTFTPSYKNHTFSPAFISENITDNVSNKNFQDITTRTISGKLTAGGGDAIGSAILEFIDTIRGKPGATFRKRVTTALTGEYSIVLPARAYKVKLIGFTSLYQDVTNPRYLAEGEVGTYFNLLAPIDSLYRNVDSFNAVLNLVYHRKPVIQIVGLVDTNCVRNPDIGVVFKQNVRKAFTLNVFEGDPVIGFRVVTLDKIQSADSLSIGDSIKIWTDLQDQTGTSPPDYFNYRLKAGKIDTSITAGVPNIVNPFNRKFKVYYTDRYKRAAETITRFTVTTGIQSPPQTFVTVAPSIPQLILHRPPGDQSYSYWEQTKTVETSQRMSVALEGSVAVYNEVKVGAEFSAGIGVQIETKVEGSINASINTTVTNNTENELTFTNATTSKYSTKAGGITGSGGDVYIGGAQNYKYGVSNVVAFNQGCAVELSEKLIIAPKGYATTFTYSEDHIVNTLMPSLEYFVSNTSGAQQSYYKNQLNVWQQVIDNNTYQKDNAKFIENRSFDGSSGGVEINKTISKSAVNTINFNLAIESAVAAKIGAEVNGTGVEGGVTVGVKIERGRSNSAAISTETTTGFLLQDQNAGDYYSVDIKEDKVYGTPVFVLVAGTSSCPPEPGAQSRDNPRIIIDNPVVSNIPLTGKGFFTIKVVNQSESRETRDYQLSLNNATSNGVTIKKGGVPLGGSDIIPINGLAYLEEREVLISVEKDDPADKIFSYPNIEFVLSDNCTGDVDETNSITANFVTPCGGIVLEEPADEWVNTLANSNFLPVTFNGYNKASIDSVTLQYAKAGTNNWIKGFTLQPFQITDPATTFPWNVSALPDSVYKLRLRLVCSGGNKIYTTNVNGILDRKAPFVVGKPQPADDNFVNGDEISFTYNENIKTGNLGAANVEMTRLSNNSTVDASISGFQNKLQIVSIGNLAAYPGDSVRVIVKNIADVYGNMKTNPDTSYFLIGSPTIVPGAKPVKLYVVKPSTFENSNGKMEIHFKLPSKASRITKVNFTITGTANYINDYSVSSDTLKKVFKDHSQNTVTLPVYNYFNSFEGYINIDSGATEAVLKIIPLIDTLFEGDEAIYIHLASGSDYILEDSTSAKVTISDPVMIVSDGPTNACNGATVGLSVTPAGNALQFDGVNDYVAVNNTLGNFGAGDFTLEMNLKPATANAGVLISKRGVCNLDNFFSLEISSGKAHFDLGQNSSGTNYASMNSTSLINDNAWHHVAVTRASGALTVYIDGAAEGTAVSNANINNAYPFVLGTSPCVPTYINPFNGNMDEVRIWNIARTPAQILAGIGGGVPANSTGLLAYYRFNEAGGNTATDATSHSNNGTLVNGPVRFPSAAIINNYVSYLWSPGGAVTASIQASTGSYTVRVTDTYGNSSTSAAIQVNVGAPATVNAGSSLLNICPGIATVALGGSFGGSATGAVWSDGGLGGTFTNNNGSTPQTTTYMPSINANGSIVLILTTLGGCSVTANKQLFVNGQTTWLGNSSNWNVESNWSNGVIPLSCTKVTIPNGIPFMPTITGIDNTCYELSLQPGATLKVETGARLMITGKN